MRNPKGDKSLDLILVAGQGKPKYEVVALDSEGEKQWSLAIPEQVGSAAACQEKPWLAIAVADGSVRVIDVGSGKDIAHVGGQGKYAQVAWLPAPDGSPLLVVATKEGLNAYRISAEKR